METGPCHFVAAVARQLALGALCIACAPLGAAVLYKSVDPNGVVQFSDTPPEKTTRDVKVLQIPDGSAAAPRPLVADAQAPLSEEKLRGMDAAVQRASAQVDLAEHALAMARRPVWSPPDPNKITTERMTRADVERIEFYKQELKVARLALCELLQEKRKSAVREEMTASAGAPIYGPVILRQ
jgi:hypothetical protein